MTLKEQAKKILSECEIPVTKFCRRVGISGTSYYRWQDGDLRLSESTEQRIKNYINELSKLF